MTLSAATPNRLPKTLLFWAAFVLTRPFGALVVHATRRPPTAPVAAPGAA